MRRLIELSYENTTIPVPLRYCEMLGKKYGDYMKLVRNVGGHDYPFLKVRKNNYSQCLISICQRISLTIAS